jgi:hypothetical protein
MRISELGIPLAVSAKTALQQKNKTGVGTQDTKSGDPQGTVGTVKPGQDPNAQNTTDKTPPIGNNASQKMDQAKFMRGQEIDVPNADNPARPEKFKVKAVAGDQVELEPINKKPGLPNSIKFNKKDLAQ